MSIPNEVFMAKDILTGNAKPAVVDDFFKCYFEEHGDNLEEELLIDYALRYSTHCLKLVKNFDWR